MAATSLAQQGFVGYLNSLAVFIGAIALQVDIAKARLLVAEVQVDGAQAISKAVSIRPSIAHVFGYGATVWWRVQ